MTLPNEHSRDNNYSFGKKILSNTVFSLLDLILTKSSTVLIFVLLVRLLPEQDIAAIGICTGYLVFIAYLEVGASRVLLRDYSKIAENKHKRNQLFTALILFWLFQTLIMLFICLGLHLFVLSKLKITGISFLFFALTIDFIALSFQDSVKTALFSSFQQFTATRVNFFSIILRCLSCILLIFYPSLNLYSYILIFISSFNFILWSWIFHSTFKFHPIFAQSTFTTLIRSLNSYGVWDHLNRMSIDTLFMIDLVILSWFASTHEISSYTIALRVTSLLFIIPLQFQRSLQLTISNYDDNAKIDRAINSGIKITFLISILQLLFMIFCGTLLLNLLFGETVNQNLIQYTIIVSIAVAIMNFSWPFLSIVNNLCNLREVFFSVFLISLIFGIIIYMITAYLWGALGVAYGNIINYLFLLSALIIFTRKKYPFSFNLKVLDIDEKKFLLSLVKRQ